MNPEGIEIMIKISKCNQITRMAVVCTTIDLMAAEAVIPFEEVLENVKQAHDAIVAKHGEFEL